MTKASLEETAAHDLVWYHQCCQGLTENHMSSTKLVGLEVRTGSSMVRGRLVLLSVLSQRTMEGHTPLDVQVGR